MVYKLQGEASFELEVFNVGEGSLRIIRTMCVKSDIMECAKFQEFHFLVYIFFFFFEKSFYDGIHNDIIGILTGSPSDKFGTVNFQ